MNQIVLKLCNVSIVSQKSLPSRNIANNKLCYFLYFQTLMSRYTNKESKLKEKRIKGKKRLLKAQDFLENPSFLNKYLDRNYGIKSTLF